MSKVKVRIYLMTLGAVVFWGISYVWMKNVYEYYEPITTMFLRLSLSSVMLYVILKIMKWNEKVAREDYRNFIILSFFSPFLFFIGESFGLKYVTATLASVIVATIPVFTPWLGLIIFRERFSVVNFFGFFISFSGVCIMVLDSDFRLTASFLGLAFLFLAVVSALVNIVILKKMTMKYSSLTIIKVQNILGALMFLPLFLIFDFKEFLVIRPSTDVYISLFNLAFFASTLAFIFFTSAVRSLGIGRTSIFANMIPVVTAITAFIILKEHIDHSKIIGIAVVIIGLLLTQKKRQRDVKKKKEDLIG